MPPQSYDSWSKEELIARLKLLDSRLPSSSTHVSASPRTKGKATTASSSSKPFHFASYPRRKIALKFCYSGWEYNGLAFQNDKTPLPTVEGTLFDALASTRLIDRDTGPEGCGWERCGRTDRGVSAAGQVVSLWVRSNIGRIDQNLPEQGPSSTSASDSSLPIEIQSDVTGDDSALPIDVDIPPPSTSSHAVSDSLKEEIRYISLLNRVLPPTIRILAWSPASPSFSSRFACKYRHYKYFFSPHGLSLPLMRDAAERLVGEHDFRNLCKLDPTKQITSFRRKILRADIAPCDLPSFSISVPDASTDRTDMYVFNLAGTAFLYHQVRHIMAILFLIGSGLESSTAMSALLNTDKDKPYPPFREGEEAPEVVDRKPEYQMADGLPLMLWECAYSDEDVKWQTDDNLNSAEHRRTGESSSSADLRAESNLYHQLHSIHSRSLIHTALDKHFLHAASVHHSPPYSPFPLPHIGASSERSTISQIDSDLVVNVPVGGGKYRRGAARTYIPLLRRKRLESVEVVNERWRIAKGGRRQAKIASVDVEDID